jgi:hypothetical protein
LQPLAIVIVVVVVALTVVSGDAAIALLIALLIGLQSLAMPIVGAYVHGVVALRVAQSVLIAGLKRTLAFLVVAIPVVAIARDAVVTLLIALLIGG